MNMVCKSIKLYKQKYNSSILINFRSLKYITASILIVVRLFIRVVQIAIRKGYAGFRISSLISKTPNRKGGIRVQVPG